MRQLKPIFLLIGIILLGGGLGFVFSLRPIEPQERHLTINARRYSYEPERITVNRGDKVFIKLTSEDVTHGFFLEGYDHDAKVRAHYPYFWLRHPSRETEYQQVEEISFVANRSGKFRYRCSVTCGSFHPFMQGELLVRPNLAYHISLGMSFGLLAGGLIYLGKEWNR